MKAKIDSLDDFVPVEQCNLKYDPERGASIDPHLDDEWLWGPRLISINLASNTILTLTPTDELNEMKDYEILLPLARRSLIILEDDSRYKWLHSIKCSHINSTRLVMTLRELSKEFKQEPTGLEIERIALTYEGDKF